MRKFKLRDQVAKKMMGLANGSPAAEQPSSADPSAPDPKPAPAKPEHLRVITRTDIGLIRKSNQDAIICGNGLMGVADGMGGHNGGETASMGARDGMIREAEKRDPSPENLETAIRAVNLELWEMQLRDPALSGMGTTLTVLWPTDADMLIGHVGDSRAYLLRNGEIKQVTDDHSLVADMVRKGILTEEQAACHPMRNYITRAVGTETDINADVFTVPRQPGDRWLICSDGLHGVVPREKLQEMLSSEDLDEAADQLIREALDQGGRDNISLVIAVDQAESLKEKETGEEKNPDPEEKAQKAVGSEGNPSPEVPAE